MSNCVFGFVCFLWFAADFLAVVFLSFGMGRMFSMTEANFFGAVRDRKDAACAFRRFVCWAILEIIVTLCVRVEALRTGLL
jgi:hypothetical protein